MDAFLIPLIHHWGGGIRPARRRGRGGVVKGASISDFNGRDGAITSIEGQYPRLACFLYMVINTARISLKIFRFYDQKGHVPPFLYNQMCFTLFRRVAFSFQHSTMYSQCYFKMCISSSAVFINNLLFQFTYFESVPWLMGGLFCLFVYQGMKNSYCALFEQKLSRFSVNGTWD